MSINETKRETLKAPWRKFEELPSYEIKYPTGTMYNAVAGACAKFPNRPALKFMNKIVNFSQLLEGIDLCAKALISQGIKKGDFVTIASPNCIEAVYSIYAVNKIGAVCNMIHPLSSAVEMKSFLNKVDSSTIIIFDMFFDNFKKIWSETKVERAIVIDISNDLSVPMRIAYKLKTKNTRPKIVYSKNVMNYKNIIEQAKNTSSKNYDEYKMPNTGSSDIAAVLYSGGATGNPKGIALTNSNFNTLTKQILVCEPSYNNEGAKILGIMPLFHGFGLGLFTHALLTNGATCILVARFNPKSFEKTLSSEKCNYLAGVPTLFEEWTKMKNTKGKDYSALLYCLWVNFKLNPC